MPLKPRKTRITKQDIPPTLRVYFESGFIGDTDEHDAAIFNLAGSDKKIDENWISCQNQILSDWISKNPCSRPWAFWRNAEPRKRIGGIGTPSSDVLAIAPSFERGIPGHWVKPFDEKYYNGRFMDVDGKKVGSFSSDGYFKGKAIDPADPPRFESQASYLQRFGLLTAAERVHLKKHNELMAPEKVTAS
jgi:hypothetical protein